MCLINLIFPYYCLGLEFPKFIFILLIVSNQLYDLILIHKTGNDHFEEAHIYT